MRLGRNRDEEFHDEIAEHLALLTEEFMRQGMTPDEARLAARRSFGAVTQVREERREALSLMHFDRLRADLKYALRSLRREPGFTITAVLTLGLGIGVNTTLFSAYNAVVLRPLPVADPASVVRFERWFASHAQGNVQYAFSYPEFEYLRDHNRSFDSLVLAAWPSGAIADSGVKLQAQRVSPNYFEALGIGMRMGRGFVAADENAVVLSHAYWKRINGDPAILGRTIQLNGTRFTVIGVTPEDFTGTAQAAAVPDCWVPVSEASGTNLRSLDRTDFQIFARLRRTVAFGSAQAEIAGLLHQFGDTQTTRDRTLTVTLQHTSFLDNTEDPRFMAAVAGVMLLVGMVLAVACANIANMLLARGVKRQQEIAIRLALGAARSRIIRQLLTESVLLGLMGGVAGLGIAIWSSRLLWVAIQEAIAGRFGSQFGGGGIGLAGGLNPDWRVLGYALAISVGAGMLFGVLPALRSTRPGPQPSRSRPRGLLVAGQVTVCMALLISAGLLTRGLARSRQAGAGFDTHSLGVLAASFGDDDAAATARQRRLIERLVALPVVRNATVGHRPLSGTWTPPIFVGSSQGRTLASRGSDTYLDTVGIPLLRGRSFTRQESASSAPVAVISEGAARTFWPGRDPVGQRFRLDMDFRGTLAEFEVIGVAKDVRFVNLSRLDPSHVYLTPKPGEFNEVFLRLNGDPREAMSAIRTAVQTVEPNIMPTLNLMTVEDGPEWLQRFATRTMTLAAGVLALLALILAATGIYGVIAYVVTQRTREIGVRMALGAGPAAVIRGVIVAALRPVFIGIVAGLGVAGAISTIVHSTLSFPGSVDFLYGVSFYDPVAFLGLSTFVLLIAAIASAGPAARAVRVDPMSALRHD